MGRKRREHGPSNDSHAGVPQRPSSGVIDKDRRIRELEARVAELEAEGAGNPGAGKAGTSDYEERLARAAQLDEQQQRQQTVEREWLLALINSLRDDVFFVNAAGKVVFANDAVRESLGLSAKEDVLGILSAIEEKFEVLKPDGTLRKAEESPFIPASRGEVVRGEEMVRHRKTGELRQRSYQVVPVLLGGKIAGAVSLVRDVTERKQAEQALRDREAWLSGQREALEAAMNDAPLEASLGVLVRAATDGVGQGVRAAFYLANDECTALHHVVGMPAAYADAVDGFRIGPESLACGLATHTGEPVLTSDVTNDARWEPWRWLAERFDYRACWSFPIHSSGGKVVGTLAIYSRQPREATERDRELGSLLTRTASVIMSRHAESKARKQAEEQLHKSEERYRRIVETAEEGIATHRTDGTITYVNQRMSDMLGYSREEIIGRSSIDFMPEDQREAVVRARESVREQGSFTGEWKLRKKDGSILWTLANIAPLRDGAGNVLGSLALHTDITGRMATEEALRESEARFRSVLDGARDVIYRVNVQTGRYEYISPSAELVVGYSPAELEALSVEAALAMVHPDDAPAMRAAVARLEQTGTEEVEYRQRAKSGEYRWISNRMSLVRDTAGRPLYRDGSIRDETERRKADAALRASEERFRTVVDNSQDGINLLDLGTGRYVLMSPSQVALTGFTIEEINNISAEEAAERVHPGDRHISIEQQNKVAAGVDPGGTPVEYRWRVKSGEYRWFSDSRKLVRDAQGKPVSLVGISRDITERKRAEAKLAADLEALTRMHALSGRGVEVAGIEPLLQETMEAAVALLHADKGTLQLLDGDTLRIAAHHGHERSFLDYFAAAESVASVCGEATRQGERVVVPDVEQSPLFAETASLPVLRAAEVRAVQSTPMLTRAGRLVGILTTHWRAPYTPDEHDLWRLDLLTRQAADLIEQKQAEEALRASESKYRNLFDSMAEEVHFWQLVRDEAGRIETWRLVDANPPALKSWGRRSVSEIRGKTTDEIFGPGATEHYMPVVQKIMTDGVPHSFEDYFPNLDKYFRSTSVPLGEYFITTGADITDIKLAEKQLTEANLQLAEADRRKNEFLAVLSHELRNPLAPIASSLYVLDHAPPAGEQADRAKQVIGRQVTQLSNLVNDLLDITRITRNKVQLQKERLELGEVVRRAVEDNRSSFEGAGIHVELAPASRPVPVVADRTRVAQVVGNLLQNSAKFTARGGRTRVSVDVEGGEAVVRVADDGVGITRETLERLFQPFTQAEQTLDRSKGGLGLGLALVKGLLELHGGRVSAHSDGLGHGAEFVARLPLDTGAALDAAAARPRLARARRRVLIIEDNVDAADSLSEALEFGDHEVAVAYNGPEGIARAREFGPDVVLCDIGLPGMDGYEVARAFRADEQLRGVFLVALSGYALPEDLQRAAEAGFQRHLPKPPVLEKLEQLLAEALRAP